VFKNKEPLYNNKEHTKPVMHYENFYTEFIAKPKEHEKRIEVLGRRTYETRNVLILDDNTDSTSKKLKDLSLCLTKLE
jgi:hypothetical protein